MTLRKVCDLNGFAQYPLNLNGSTIEHYELQYFYSELQRLSSSLFVDHSRDCNVEIFELMIRQRSEESTKVLGEDISDKWSLSSFKVSSLHELQDLSKVFIILSEFCAS